MDPFRDVPSEKKKRRRKQKPTMVNFASTVGISFLLLLLSLCEAKVSAADRPQALRRTTDGCGITNISSTVRSPTTVKLEWDSDCPVVLKYKLYLHHERYLACPPEVDSPEEEERRNTTVLETTTTNRELTGLRPFSDYSLEMIAILPRGGAAGHHPQEEEDEFRFRTPQGLPEVRPLEDKSYPPKALRQALHFHWQPAEKGLGEREACERRNGMPDGHHAELWAADRWGAEDVGRPVRQVDRPEIAGVNSWYIEKLKPFTRYMLRVYSKNRGGRYNLALPLELHARTFPTRPKPPTDLRTLPREDSVHLRWRPAYPPTGEVDHYTLRVGLAEGSEAGWKRGFDVSGSQWCVGDDEEEEDLPEERRPICWRVGNLTAGTSYKVEIQTTNKEIDRPSEFSAATHFRTPGKPSASSSTSDYPTTVGPTTEPTSKEPSDPRSEEEKSGGGADPLVVVLGLVAAVLVLAVVITFLFFKIKMSKLKMRYEQGGYPMVSPPPSTAAAGLDDSHMRSPPGRGGGGDNDFQSTANTSYAPGMSTATDLTLNGSIASSRYFGSSALSPWQQGASGSQTRMDSIQGRRLPEPPPQESESIISTLGRRGKSPSSALPGPPGVMVHPPPPLGTGARDHLYEDAEAAVAEAEEREKRRPSSLDLVEDSTDIDGYLKPTFGKPRTRSPSPLPPKQDGAGKEVIPVESYVTAEDALNDVGEYVAPSAPSILLDPDLNSSMGSGNSGARSTTGNESRPLMTSNSVQV